MSSISFHSEQIEFTLLNQSPITSWLTSVCSTEGHTLGELSYIFCSDEFLLELNRTHLNHDYYTDVITFDYTDKSIISGDIFISIDRVRENASEFESSFDKELQRVMVHGLLHLLGYKDNTTAHKKEMTRKEDIYLSLQSF